MKIVIEGEPIAQIRMKYSGRNGISRIYDPREKDKRQLKRFIALEHVRYPMFEHPRVSFIFHMPIPKSVPKKLLPLYNSGLLKHQKKPDVDNFIKLYLDCMDGICFEGDQKVSLGNSIKLYHPFPKTIIIVNEATELLSPLEVDPMTWYALFGQECGRCSSYEIACLPDSYTPTLLEYSQCPDMIYPQQTVLACESWSPVPVVLERARQASLQSHPQP